MAGLIKIVTMLFVLVAFFGILIHPQFLSTTLNGTKSVISTVQKG